MNNLKRSRCSNSVPVVGVSVDGLNVEQRKRLTIGVQLTSC